MTRDHEPLYGHFSIMTHKNAEQLSKDFLNPDVLDKSQNTPGEFVLNAPVIEENLKTAESDRRLIETIERTRL